MDFESDGLAFFKNTLDLREQALGIQDRVFVDVVLADHLFV